MNFKLAISKSTTKQSNLKLRYEIILKYFLKQNKVKSLDEKRFFSLQQRRLIFRRDKGKCKICKKNLSFGKSNTQFHHLDKYREGGKTLLENGVLVCKKCHLNKFHN